jgi:hypothetical protein
MDRRGTEIAGRNVPVESGEIITIDFSGGPQPGDGGPQRRNFPIVTLSRPGGTCSVRSAAAETPALMNQINPAFNRGDVERTMSSFAEDRTFLMAQARPEARRARQGRRAKVPARPGRGAPTPGVAVPRGLALADAR